MNLISVIGLALCGLAVIALLRWENLRYNCCEHCGRRMERGMKKCPDCES